MISPDEIGYLAEAYVDGSLRPEEKQELERRRKEDPWFDAAFQETLDLVLALKAQGRRQRFRKKLGQVAQKHRQQEPPRIKPTISLQKHYFRTALVAATIALITSLGSFWLVQNHNRQMTSQYRLLKRDIENYKQDQARQVAGPDLEAADPARFTGTGFAIGNKGFLVTNYHLTEGADSIFIETSAGMHLKTRVMAVDPQHDVAILQVEQPDFRFSQQDVPYVIKEDKLPIGTPIFTLGFPQDEIVYHEGYVSARNGFQGDSMQYRLNLPSAPGQSGAPVLDRSGTLIGIITGKENLSEGTTYAVCTQALLDLIEKLPEDTALPLPRKNRIRGLSPEQQVKKMEPFTFAVKVYKK